VTAPGDSDPPARAAGAPPASFGAADLARVALEASPWVVGAVVRALHPRPREGFTLVLEAAPEGGVHREASRLHSAVRLLVSLEPGLARAHLEPPEDDAPSEHDHAKARAERRRERRDESRLPSTEFLDRLRARLVGMRLLALEEVAGDRVLKLSFAPEEAALSAPEAPPTLALWLSFFAARADALLEDARSGEALVGLREGASRPLLSQGAAPVRAPLFPEVEADPASLAVTRAIAARFAQAEADRAAEEERRSFAAELRRALRKAQGAQKRLAEAAEATSRADEHQRTGEMLMASLHLVKRGALFVEVPDYWAASQAADGEIPVRRIDLDPTLPPGEQAERLFKAAKKAKRGAVVTRERLARFTAEVQRLEEALTSLEEGAPVEAVARHAGVRIPGRTHEGAAPARGGKEGARGAGRPPSKRSKAEKDGPGGPRRFRSQDGLDILVGRSNRENDELTTRIARSNDLFFHVSGVPGSHVIVRAEKGKSVALETILDAATLAAHFSKARGRPRVEVGYTPRKWVRKPRGAKPGLVLVEREKTIVVAGEGPRLARLLAGPNAPPDAESGVEWE